MRILLARHALVPRSAEAFHASIAAWDRVEEFEHLDLLDARRTLAEARIGYTTAVAELNEAAATLEELSGTRLVPDPEEK